MQRELKGWHVAAMFVCGFGVIIAVNLTLAFSAVRTFPGLETKNSYIASQFFDENRAAQKRLGWTISATLDAGELRVSFRSKDGGVIAPHTIDAVLGRATHVHEDVTPAFVFDGQAYVAPVALGDGYWNLRLKATAADGTLFQKRVLLFVRA